MFTKIQYGTEASAYGTECVSWSEAIRVQSASIESENNFIYDAGLGEGLNAVSTTYGPFDASGSLAFSVVDFDMLKHWIGPKSGAGTAGDHYKLTEATALSVSSSHLQPFSIEILNDDGTDSDSSDFGWGCVGKDFSLSGELGGKLEFSGNFVAQKSGFRSTGETYTPNTNSSFVMINGTWKWGATPSALSGVRSFTLNYDNKLNTDTRTVESRFISIPKLGAPRGYTFEVSIIMANALKTTIINDFYGYETGGVYTPETGSVSTSPTSSLEFELEFVNGSKYGNIQLDECSIDNISKSINLGGDLVLLTFKGTARKGLGNVPIEWWNV